ncbi:MAG: 2-polyprenyl-6-methoxyphenol hydroxylase [Betaproteobacteria bacterium]|nr:2-polyprenyl-6-methoxyphenol hydroxylase [Betaproteobacteria bacterium]
MNEVPVLIAGGGPIGLALAADLGRRGVQTMLVEQNDDQVGTAKMIVVSVRTMEYVRQLGIAEEVRHWGFPLDYCLDSLFVTHLQGYELGRIRQQPLRVEADTPFSPERERPCPQTWFDPILQKFARKQASVSLRYKTRLESFLQDEDGVTAELTDVETGKQETVRCDYLVGCDGYTSTVRDLLGIEVRGVKHLDLSMSVYVRIKDLAKYHDKGDTYRTVFAGREGIWSVLTTMDGKDLYRVQLVGAHEIDVRKHDLDQVMRRMLGPGVPYEIVETSLWARKMTVADRFVDGRVIIAGDSAHAHPPNGGLGMNTGIQDAWDLGWKLDAVLRGWGGSSLVESYDYERRPAASRAAGESLKNYFRLVGKSTFPQIDDATPEGERVRRELGARQVAENEKSWQAIGVHLGYMYDPSPIVVPDGTPRPEDDTVGYVPTARPGSRAPHAALSGKQSMLDLFGPGFVLLNFGDAATAAMEAAAAKRGLPLEVKAVKNAEAAALYERRLVLVRPDGHVAWRGDSVPGDALAVIDTVRGAGPRIAARRANGVL